MKVPLALGRLRREQRSLAETITDKLANSSHRRLSLRSTDCITSVGGITSIASNEAETTTDETAVASTYRLVSRASCVLHRLEGLGSGAMCPYELTACLRVWSAQAMLRSLRLTKTHLPE